MKYLLAFTIAFASITNAQAALKSEMVTYKQGDAEGVGYLAYDDAVKGKRPGVLIVHDWMGLGENSKNRANMLARMGYIAFCADIYGKGVRPKDGQEASKLSSSFKQGDRKPLRARAQAALDVLKSQKLTDTDRTAAIGYCFGGTTVLELARSGADVKGVVSFHGALNTPNPDDAKNIKAKVLALHGADDPYVPPAEVTAFEDEMRKAKVDWQLVKYSDAVHAFTIVEAGSDNSKGAAYNEKADKRSWEAMKSFFDEVFK